MNDLEKMIEKARKEVAEKNEEAFRAHQLTLLPNKALISIVSKLFDFLTSFVDLKGRRPFDLIIEKGETDPALDYYCSRKFELGKHITSIGGELPQKIDVYMKVIITAVAEVHPTTDVDFKVSEEAAKKYNPPEVKP
jgi:hypothetical protein